MIGDDYFPLQGVEYSSTGKMITQLEVLELNETKLDSKLFMVPESYSLFERKID